MTERYTTMTIRELLEIAIQHEIGSQELYRNLKTIVTDRETLAYVDDLVREEENHETILRSIIDNNLYDMHSVIEDQDVADAVRSSHSVIVRITENAKMEDVMQLALQREHRARMLFEQLSEHAVDEEQRLLFIKLAEEESTHQDVIEKRFAIRTGSMGYEM